MHRALQIPLRRFLWRHPLKQSPKPTSSFSQNPPKSPIPRPASTQFQRRFGSDSGESERNREVDMINLKFAEAREEIEMAMESKETVYFDEEAECARAAVKEVLDMFEGLSAKLSESDRAALQRSMGLKIQQLKAELQQLND